MKYVIYARVSTALDEQKTSYDVQTEDLQKKIAVLYPDYELVKTYGDLGISGTKEDRPAFQQMLSEADNFDLVITKSISRFARNARVLLNSINQLEEKGAHVYFLEENINTGSASQKFLLTVLGALAEMESNNLREHVKEGFAIKRAAGKLARPSAICFGYALEDHNVVINEEEAAVVKQVFQWYVEDNVSVGGISRRLKTSGYKTRRGKTGWPRTTVIYMLKNRKYTGDVEEMDGEYVFENAYPQIVSRETFERAQKILNARSTDAKKHGGDINNFQPHLYALSGICFCKECGQKFTRYSSHKEFDPLGDLIDPSYGTPVWGCLDGSLHNVKCKNYRISEQYLYEMIIEAICHGAKNGVQLESIKQMRELCLSLTDDYEAQYEAYTAAKKELEKKRKKELDLYSNDLISLDEVTARVKRIDKELMSLQPPKTDESIKVNKEHIDAFLQAIGHGRDPRSHLRELFKNSDIKRSIIKAFVCKIEIGGEPKYRADVYLRPHYEIIDQPLAATATEGQYIIAKALGGADVYLRDQKEIICQTDRRGPYRRHRREGVVVVSSPINIIEEFY